MNGTQIAIEILGERIQNLARDLEYERLLNRQATDRIKALEKQIDELEELNAKQAKKLLEVTG